MTAAITVPLPPSITEPLDEARGRALVESWQASGLSSAALCRQHGLRPQRLHYWRERLGYRIKVVAEAPWPHSSMRRILRGRGVLGAGEGQRGELALVMEES